MNKPLGRIEDGSGTHISFEFPNAICAGKVKLILIDRELLYERFQLLVVLGGGKVAQTHATRRD